MTPQNFILSKRKQFPPLPKLSPEDRLKITREMNLTKEETDALLQADLEEDFLLFLFRQNRFRISQPILDLFDSGKLALGEINNSVPNAHYKKLDGGYAITFNVGLRNFIYRIIRAYSTRFAFPGGPDPQISFEETCQKIADIYWWFFVSDGHSIGPDYPISRDQKIMANILTSECEFFFLAHEIGHLTLDITNTTTAANLSPMEEENAVDLIALQMSLSGRNKNGVDLIYSGIEIAFLIFDGLAKLGMEMEDHAHPKSIDRIRNLRTSLERNFPNDYMKIRHVSDINEKMFTEVMSVVSGREKKYGDFFEKTSVNFTKDVHKLLQKCSKGFVPDHMGFRKEMTILFDMGYHHILFKIIDDIVENMRTTNAPNLEIFNKYKLFLGFCDTLKEPVKSIFQKRMTP
jgi:hypothetical protein